MVSLPTQGTSRRLTASWATSRTVHRARPSGGSVHTMAMILCFWLSSRTAAAPGALLLIECAFEATLAVTMADLANGLWSEWDHAGNAWRTDALGQLQERQSSQDDTDLL